MKGLAGRLSFVVVAGIALWFTACSRAQSRQAPEPPTRAAAAVTAPRRQSAPAPVAASSTRPQPSPAASVPASSAPPAATQPKLVASDHNQTFTVAQQTFRLLTHVETIDGTNDQTVEWWELRNAQDRVIYRSSAAVEIENGSFAGTLAISGSEFNTAQGSGILIHGFELPSAPGAGGWVQLFGFKYGGEKYGVDESLFVPFGPPIVVDGEFLDVGPDSSGPTPVPLGGPTVTVMHDFLRFRLGTGNFNIVYPVLVNWIAGQLQPGARCIEMTSKGRVERCSYPITVEAHRDNQPTFVRLFPEADDGFTPKHIIVRPRSKIDYLEARTAVTWKQDDKAISFSIDGDTWLKVRIDGHEGWIHSQEDFDAVGLPQSG